MTNAKKPATTTKGRRSSPTTPPAPATLAALIGAKRLKVRPSPDRKLAELAKRLSRAGAGACAPDVVDFLALSAKHAVRGLGLWQVASPKEMVSVPTAKTRWDDPSAIASATSTLHLGKDGSGAHFFVVRHKTLSEVFIYDPGAGQLALLASSLRAFVALNDLVGRFDDLCEAEDVDPDPEEMDDIDFSKPAFAALRAGAKALRGQVNLVTHSDYDETVCALARSTLRAKSATDTALRFKRWKAARAQRGGSAE